MTASPTRQAAQTTDTTTARFLLTHRRRTQGFREPLGPASGSRWPWAAGDANAPSLTMLWIPPGRFWMGSPPDEPDRRDTEGPQHLVQLQGFFLAQTPITQAQWRLVADWRPGKGEPTWSASLKANPSRFNGDRRPVEQVSWHDAMEFCSRLSQRTGRRYTLPSEAQWEYACRAGTTTPFHFGGSLSPKLANYVGSQAERQKDNRDPQPGTTNVATFPANPWGLHDMHGNVWEWCADHWHETYDGAPQDGLAWVNQDADGKQNEDDPRLLRGGSWDGSPGYCRSAYRDWDHPGFRGSLVGFRVCCLPQD